MKSIFDVADIYLENSDWKTISILKLCLLALGIMIGMCVKLEKKKAVYAGAGAVFAVTYIPLMYKLYRTIKE